MRDFVGQTVASRIRRASGGEEATVIAAARVMAVAWVLAFVVFGCGDDDPTEPKPCSSCMLSIPASHDVTVYEDPEGETSNSAGEGIFAGRTSVGRRILHPPRTRRAFIRFELSDRGIPANIDSVALSLTVTRSSALTGRVPFRLHKVLAAWGEGFSEPRDEGGAGTAASEGDATWLHTFYPDRFWETPGGDFEPEPSGSLMVDAVGERVAFRSAARMKADVVAWLGDPSKNFGWVILGDENTTGTTKRFGSRENPVVKERPVLTVYYTRSN